MTIDYTDNVDEILAALDSAAVVALEQCGQLAGDYAKKLCPFITGNLKNSITHAVDTDEDCVYIGTDVRYGKYVENGTYKKKARPYLKPAVADHIDTYRSIIENTLRKS